MPEAHPRPSLMHRLREETREAHETTEKAVDLASRLREPARYRILLERFHGLHAGMDRMRWHLPLYASGLRSGWLAQDLRALGLSDAEIRRIPPCDRLPVISSTAHEAGCLYVIEGSTLGGQWIARQVARALGYDASGGARYFHGYGKETMPRWRRFGETLDSLAPDMDHAEAVHAATSMFHAFGQWIGTPG